MASDTAGMRSSAAIVGALSATAFSLAFSSWPALPLLPLTLVAGALAGLLWGAVPGYLKAHMGVNEILSTVMLNHIALQSMNFLLRIGLVVFQTRRILPRRLE